MIIKKTKFKDLLIIKQKNYIDKRGNLRETFNNKILKKKFVYEYSSISKKNVLRGFHFQTKFKQTKLISVLDGKILDVVIDLRKNSKTFGKTFKVILSKKNAISLLIPAGFGHAYYSYTNNSLLYYKLDNYYSPKYENGIIFNDRQIKFKWPSGKKIISNKDKNLGSFKQFLKKFKSL